MERCATTNEVNAQTENSDGEKNNSDESAKFPMRNFVFLFVVGMFVFMVANFSIGFVIICFLTTSAVLMVLSHVLQKFVAGSSEESRNRIKNITGGLGYPILFMTLAGLVVWGYQASKKLDELTLAMIFMFIIFVGVNLVTAVFWYDRWSTISLIRKLKRTVKEKSIAQTGFHSVIGKILCTEDHSMFAFLPNPICQLEIIHLRNDGGENNNQIWSKTVKTIQYPVQCQVGNSIVDIEELWDKENSGSVTFADESRKAVEISSADYSKLAPKLDLQKEPVPAVIGVLARFLPIHQTFHLVGEFTKCEDGLKMKSGEIFLQDPLQVLPERVKQSTCFTVLMTILSGLLWIGPILLHIWLNT